MSRKVGHIDLVFGRQSWFISRFVKLCAHKSNQIKFICEAKQNLNECDIIIRQMCRQDTKAVPTALTGALGSKNTNYNSK